MAHAAIVRSPLAHARIVGIDPSRALARPGVLAAVSFSDLGPDPTRLPMLVPHKSLRPQMPFPLASGRVRYVGEPVAVVVAESAYEAEDALEFVNVEYDELQPVTDPEAALEAGATLLHESTADNLAAAVTQT